MTIQTYEIEHVIHERFSQEIPPDMLELINQVKSEENMLMAEDRHNGFLAGEKFRQFQGFSALYGLLALRDKDVNRILGISKIPKEFSFKKDWLQPTGEHEFSSQIEIPIDIGVESPLYRLAGQILEVRGVRIQTNIIDREGLGEKFSDFITPVGGGTRVDIRSGDDVEEVGDKKWKIKDGEVKIADLRDEGRALAAAMVPKNLSLEFPAYLAKTLAMMDLPVPGMRKSLLRKVKKVILGGGAKADIMIAAPKINGGENKLTPDEEIELVKLALFEAGKAWGEQGVIGYKKDRLAGDRNTTTKDKNGNAVLNSLVEGYIAALEAAKGDKLDDEETSLAMATVTGKSGKYGLEARGDATGWGAWSSYLAYEKHVAQNNDWPIDSRGIPEHIKKKKVFFRGCGSAAARAIVEASEAGMWVHGIAERGAVITSGEGFKENDARELFEISVNHRFRGEKITGIAEWVRIKRSEGRDDLKVYFEADPNATKEEKDAQTAESVNGYWQDQKPQVIFEAATQMTINKDNAYLVPDESFIVEIGNGVVTPIASQILKNRDIDHITGINCNAGGVDVSWFEWAKNVFGVNFNTADIEKAVADMMENNMEQIFELQTHLDKHNIKMTQEEIFYALAMARGLKSKFDLEKHREIKKMMFDFDGTGKVLFDEQSAQEQIIDY